MDQLLVSVTVSIAALAAFLVLVSALQYAVADAFVRMRLTMTAFLCFIVITLTAAFWQWAAASLWLSIPTLILGVLVGHFVGARAAQERLLARGVESYVEHFAHVHLADVRELQWWTLINFYSIAAALVVINLLGLTVVFFNGREGWAMATCAVGAFLVGTMAPYLVHLWAINAQEA